MFYICVIGENHLGRTKKLAIEKTGKPAKIPVNQKMQAKTKRIPKILGRRKAEHQAVIALQAEGSVQLSCV